MIAAWLNLKHFPLLPFVVLYRLYYISTHWPV